MKFTKYELMPNDSHKSFYKKAICYVAEDGSQYLRSYDTIIAKMVNGKVIERYWDAEVGMQNTTLRHIRAWCNMCKKEFMAIPYKDSPDVKIELEYINTNAGQYWCYGGRWV